MMKSYIFYILCVLVACSSCKSLSEERLSQFDMEWKVEHDSLGTSIYIKNPVHAPLRIRFTELYVLETYGESRSFLVLGGLQDTTLYFEGLQSDQANLNASIGLGDISKSIKIQVAALPFPKGKSYRLMQGYNSTPSHNTDYSRYALDFDLQVGDTICAATPGYVVGIVEDYSLGGSSNRWRPYANFVTVFDTISGMYTQTVHLDHKGALVDLGDYLEKGSVIGLSGNTGYTTAPHLHFNVLVPIDSDAFMESAPIDSIGDYKISELKRGDWLRSD